MPEFPRSDFRLHVGWRNIKTSVTAMLVAMVYCLIGRNPAFACIGVIFGMGTDMPDSIKNGGNRLFGTLIGGLLSIAVFWVYLHFYPQGGHSMLLAVLLGIATVILILLCQYFWPGGVQPGGVVLCIVLYSTPVETYVSYALNRILDTTIGVIVALLLVGIIVFAVSKDKKRWTARMLANGALCIALATVLSFVTLYKMPQGGTITLASMLPIFLFSYAYGVGPGMLVGAAYGFVQFLQGGLYFVHPIELLLDYPLAFAMLGLAGLANKFSDKWGMIPGIILGTFGRFVCAFLSGMIFFGMYAPEGQNLVVYSIVYNGLYLVPEAIICIVLALIPQIRQLAKRLALQD